MRDLVHQFKFDADLVAGAALADLMLPAVRSRAARIEALVPVPMPAGRVRERGFNQAAVLAAWLGRRLGVRVCPSLCLRIGSPRPQRTMPDASARRHNVRGTFAVAPGGTRPARVAVVDDVVTTGSTVSALSRALLRAGVGSVEVWAAARGGSGVEVRD